MDLMNFFQELDSIFKTKNIKDAEDFVIAALAQAQKEENIPAIVAIANELGGIYRVTNRLEEGKKVYAIALQGIKTLGLENTEQHGTTLLNLASVYSEGKEAAEALKLYTKVAVLFNQAGLKQDYRMAALYNNISHVYDELNQMEEALTNAENALEIIKQLPDNKVELATTYTTLAIRYIRQKRYAEAETNLKLAEKIFLSLPGKVDVHYAATLNTMGEFYFDRESFDLSAEYFDKALRLIRTNYGENTAFFEVAKNLAKVKAMMGTPGKRVTGLERSEQNYNHYGREMIQEKFPEIEKFMAIGLVGEGSECLGFDDELSEDHDFSPGFCIWLPEEIFQQSGAKLQAAYDQLPKPEQGKPSLETSEGKGRTGVFSISDFYKKYTGCPGVPKSNVEWLFANEVGLSTATSGKVFQDNLGEFSRIRSQLLAFYPNDIYLKKIVARMAQMSQSGQYNYERSAKRGDFGAAYLACSEFIKATGSMVYLLNRKYMPFYKWMFRGMTGLENLNEIKTMLESLIATPDRPENTARKVAAIEEICIKVNHELNRQGIINGSDPFLVNHCPGVMNSIVDPQIKSLPILFDAN